MVEGRKTRLTADDWLHAALEVARSSGIQAVRVAPLATSLGVTTGSFYWHFKDRRALLDALLAYWERAMTDVAIEDLSDFQGSPLERVLALMKRVMLDDLARYDLPIWHWAKSDEEAATVFRRVIRRRLEFASRLFREAGFSQSEAEVRGRMMTVYLMGEATLFAPEASTRLEFVEETHHILTREPNESSS